MKPQMNIGTDSVQVTAGSSQDSNLLAFVKPVNKKIKLEAGEQFWDILDEHKFVSNFIPAGVDLINYKNDTDDLRTLGAIFNCAQLILKDLNQHYLCGILMFGDIIRMSLMTNENEHIFKIVELNFVTALHIAAGVDVHFQEIKVTGNDGTSRFERASPDRYLACLTLVYAYHALVEKDQEIREHYLIAAGYLLGQAWSIYDKSKLMLFIHEPEFLKKRASKAAKAKSIKSDKSKDKHYVRNSYIDWKMGKSTFKSTAAFIQFSLDRCKYVESSKTLERWVREWKIENENGALLAE